MRSAARGLSTSQVEVTNISTHGFWLLVRGGELFLSFKDFPWFKKASIDQIVNVELPQPEHLYWPDLDVDLDIESIIHPEKFPLVAVVATRPATPTTEKVGTGSRRPSLKRTPPLP